METFDIAVIEGDGIGPEVTREAMAAADAAGPLSGAELRWTKYPWGTDFYFQHGRMAPPDYLDQLARHDAILLGAVGHPQVQDHVTLNGLLLPIRRRFDQYVCLRPALLYEGVASPLVGKAPRSIDMLVFRENTAGEYANVGGRVYQHSEHDVAIQTSVFTRRGCERIIRAAFEKARQRPRQRVASITKSNAQGYGMVLWDEMLGRRRPRDFPRDCHRVAPHPSGRYGIRPPARIVRRRRRQQSVRRHSTRARGHHRGQHGPGGQRETSTDPPRSPSMFEPVHGSAPDITGQAIANPLAAVLSAAMMLEQLQLDAAAAAIQRAVADLLRNTGGPRTPDLQGTAKTSEVGQAVVAGIRKVAS